MACFDGISVNSSGLICFISNYLTDWSLFTLLSINNPGFVRPQYPVAESQKSTKLFNNHIKSSLVSASIWLAGS